MIEKGTTIICPTCSEKIAIVRENLFLGEYITADSFEFFKDKWTSEGPHITCPKCGGEWVKRGVEFGLRFYTTEGWKP